mgnify:CR=1 FL=1
MPISLRRRAAHSAKRRRTACPAAAAALLSFRFQAAPRAAIRPRAGRPARRGHAAAGARFAAAGRARQRRHDRAAARGAGAPPIAVALGAVRGAAGALRTAEQLAAEVAAQGKLGDTPDFKAAMRAFGKGKKPVFTGKL